MTHLGDPAITLGWFIVRFLLVGLFAYRVQRLITTDDITEPYRLRLTPDSWPRKLVECPWCLGTWISIAIFLLDYYVAVPLPFILIGAGAAVVGRFADKDN